MKRFWRIVAASSALVLASCAKHGEFRMEWLDTVATEVTVSEMDGHKVKLDEANEVIYVESCDFARQVTDLASGASTAGWGYICHE